jgi:thymidylate kinase
MDSNGKTADSVHLPDEEWRKKYKWQLNEKVLDQLLKQHSKAERIFLCGRANIFQYWDKADKVFLLKVDAPTLLQRLNSETRDNLFAKDAATQNQLIDSLEETQDRITKRGAIVIDATLPISEVVELILKN